MRGTRVLLYVNTRAGSDALNDPVWAKTPVAVDNVLIGQPTTDEVTSTIDLFGKRADYVLAIPKGDGHNWENAEAEFFGRRWRTLGMAIQGIEENVPTPWHKKVLVARNE